MIEEVSMEKAKAKVLVCFDGRAGGKDIQEICSVGVPLSRTNSTGSSKGTKRSRRRMDLQTKSTPPEACWHPAPIRSKASPRKRSLPISQGTTPPRAASPRDSTKTCSARRSPKETDSRPNTKDRGEETSTCRQSSQEITSWTPRRSVAAELHKTGIQFHRVSRIRMRLSTTS